MKSLLERLKDDILELSDEELEELLCEIEVEMQIREDYDDDEIEE